jgi:hypothetical protein
MQNQQAIQDWLKERANTIALGLLFASLLAIYLVAGPGYTVTALGVILLALGLYIVVDGDWGDLLVLAVFAGLVSIVAAYIVAQARFGSVGAVFIPLLWTIVLFLLARRIMRGIRPVPIDPESPAILISRGKDRRPYVAPPPLVIPFLQRIVAVVPRKVMVEEVEVEKLNTKGYHDVPRVAVHVRYWIEDPIEAYVHASQTTLDEAARKMSKNLDEARLDVTYWERLFEDHLLKIDIIKAIREVIFQEAGGSVEHYTNRAKLEPLVFERLNELVAAWGARIELVELDYFELDPERVGRHFRDRSRETEALEAAHYAVMEANRLKQVLGSEVEAEALRVKAIIDALRQSEVEITPDVVIRAIRAASDWVMEGEYSLQPTAAPTSTPLPPPRPPAPDKKDNGPKR